MDLSTPNTALRPWIDVSVPWHAFTMLRYFVGEVVVSSFRIHFNPL